MMAFGRDVFAGSNSRCQNSALTGHWQGTNDPQRGRCLVFFDFACVDGGLRASLPRCNNGQWTIPSTLLSRPGSGRSGSGRRYQLSGKIDDSKLTEPSRMETAPAPSAWSAPRKRSSLIRQPMSSQEWRCYSFRLDVHSSRAADFTRHRHAPGSGPRPDGAQTAFGDYSDGEGLQL